MWTAVLIFIVLPVALIVLAFKIRPLVDTDQPRGDALGGMRAAGGLFGSHGLAPDERSVREDTERIRLNLDQVKARE
ncbi:hypothetical protein [Deinococcus marmoris]|uniref:Uncharacterized protein n=1 Tax=Deinococcus marmoris TaxID=249408 RepID=A0A1U7NVW4_9DEIO|nr:hypothetical protein [Deinococcus marmoris]OLV17073.1 hypothetical protein BOO71_0010033 [Deinococcus marmoris]